MRFQKIKIFAGIFFVIIIVFTAMGFVFQYGTKYYVEQRIQTELNGQIDRMKTGYYDEINGMNFSLLFPEIEYEVENEQYMANQIDAVSVFYESSYTENNLVPVNLIVVSSEFERLNKTYDNHILLIQYCKEHQEMFQENRYRHVKIRKNEYFVMQRNDIINNEKVVFIITASPDELYQFVDKINIIFIAIMIVSAVILFLVSYQIGIKTSKSKQKLNYYFQNASHELKTPIMSIQGYAEGIHTNIIKDHERASEIILSESERMSRLVGEILYLSKMDSGFADMNREKLDIGELLYDCMNMLENEAKRKNVEFKVETDNLEMDNLEIDNLEMDNSEIDNLEMDNLATNNSEIDNSNSYVILGNEEQLERMLLNLLSNAVRYAKSCITVNVSKNRKWIRIDIKDDGMGIKKEDMPHIFDRFYKSEGGQSGIGLAIAKEIVRLHRGKIKVSNENGAKFSVWLKASK